MLSLAGLIVFTREVYTHNVNQAILKTLRTWKSVFFVRIRLFLKYSICINIVLISCPVLRTKSKFFKTGQNIQYIFYLLDELQPKLQITKTKYVLQLLHCSSEKVMETSKLVNTYYITCTENRLCIICAMQNICAQHMRATVWSLRYENVNNSIFMPYVCGYDKNFI